MFLRSCCILTRNSCSLYQPTFNNMLKCKVQRTHFLSARFNSIDKSILKNEAVEEERKSDDESRFKCIQLELSYLRQSGKSVPDADLIKKHQWEELLKLNTKSAKQSYYKYLFKMQKRIENKKIKQKEQQKLRENMNDLLPKKEDSHVTYGLGKHTFFMRINNSAMNLWRNNRLIQAMQFGEKLIFDCSYDEHMTSREAKNAAKQLMYCFAENRLHREPFDLHFCNANFNGDTMKQLGRHIPTIRNKDFPLHLHEGSFLDLFPREQLTYLTPHCENDLIDYDPDMIYIVGAMVDKSNQKPLSSSKAKKLDLKMARLPLDKHLNWGNGGGKCLTLDQMIRIMLELKKSRNWEDALKHVPRRKIK